MSTTSTQVPCALCRDVGQPCQSHIVPKFVFDWIKRRGGHIRGFDKPNVGLQDGPNPRLLCQKCEQRFSGWERDAALIFRTIHSSSAPNFEYGVWFLPFAVSVSFRVLSYYEDWATAMRATDNTVGEHRDASLASWRDYLLGRRLMLGPYDHHCVVLPSETPSNPEGRLLQHFFDGIIDFQPPIVAPDGSIVVVTKLCRLCIVGTLKRGRRDEWVNTRIAAKGGSFGSPFAMPSWFVDHLGTRFTAVRKDVRRLSPRQRALLWQEARSKHWFELS